MIALSNGHSFEYMAASGALEFDGKGWPWEQPLRWCGLLDPSLFTVVIKTLTRHPRKGNLRMYKPWGCVRLIKNGSLNAISFTNPGVEWWCKHVGPTLNSKNIPIIGSIYSDDPRELEEMAKMLNAYDLVGLEVNVSCPNTTDDLLHNTEKVIESVKAVKTKSRFPLLVKLSVVHDVEAITQALEKIVEAININTVPWRIAFPDRSSPLARLGGGGVGGHTAQQYTWTLVEKLSHITSIPVIGPSIWDYEDIAKVRIHGAKAIAFGSIFLRYPWRPTLFIRKDMKQYGVESVRT